MSKRHSDITVNKQRKLAQKRVRRAGSVNIGVSGRALPERHNLTPQGSIVQRYVKSGQEPGDLRTVFGREYVAFKGGEGGRNWTVRSTKW